MSDELNSIICASCGIRFGYPKSIDDIWRASHKVFYCPNGHTLTFGETAIEKEHKEKLKEVVELKEKLTTALKEIEVLKEKVNSLTLEVEIWNPGSLEKLVG